MKMPNKKGFAPLVILVVVAVIGVSGTATVAVSQDSVPKDALYPVKTLTENIRLATALSPENKASLQVALAAERVEEIKVMVETKGIDAPGLEVAQTRMESHTAEAAEIVEQEKQKGKDVSKLAGEIVDKFHLQRKEVKAVFENAKQEFFTKKKQLHEQLLTAIKAGDTALVEEIRSELIQIEAAKDEAEAKKDAITAVLEVEKDRLQDELEEKKRQEDEIRDAAERADEERKEAEEKQRELEGKMREEEAKKQEKLSKAKENERERIQKEAERELEGLKKEQEQVGEELKRAEEKQREAEERLIKLEGKENE